jgi:hypothetical protein
MLQVHLGFFPFIFIIDETINQERVGKRLLCLQWMCLKCKLLQQI